MARRSGSAPAGAGVCGWRVLAIAAMLAAGPAAAIDYVWNNASGGNWNVAANWTPNGVPNAATDTATITLAGTYTVTVNTAVTVNTLTIGGATGTQTLAITAGSVNLNAGVPPATMTVNANGAVNQTGGNLQGGPAQVTMNGRYDMSGGSINTSISPFTVGPGATFALAGGAAKFFQSASALVNNGTITNSGTGSLQIEGNSVLTNAAGGVIDLQSDAGIVQLGGGQSTLNNAGTLRKSAGAGTSLVALAQIANTGLIEAQSGTLQLGSTFQTVTSSGAGNAFGALGGATLAIGASNGTYTFTGTTFTGPGLKSLAGGATASYTFGATITASNTTFASGTLRGTFTLAGTLGWTGGSFYGSPTIGPGATLALSGSLGKTLATSGPAATLTNQGTITIAGSENLYVENSAVLTNAAGGVLDLQADVGIVQLGGGQSTLNNAGTLRKSGGTGTSAVNVVTISNTGVFDAQSGTLSVTQPGNAGAMQSSGAGNAFNAQTGAALTINAVSSATFSGTAFGGPGAKSIGSVGSVSHTYSGTISATNTTILGGFHTGTFTLNGDLTLNAGTLRGVGTAFHMTIPAGATFVVAGGGAKSLLGGGNIARITNSGTLRFSSTSSLQGNDAAFIQNTAGGLIEFLAQGGLGTLGSVSPSVLENAGTVRFASGTSVPVVSWQVTNTGTISVQSGLFAWSGTNASFGQTAGRLELVGGNMSNEQHLSISGGVLAGTGAIQGPGAVNLSGTAQTRPGTSPGQLTFGGALTQTGTYFAELNGVAPATQYDQLVGQGNVTVGGTLTVSLGFVPPIGTVFRIIDKTSAGAVVGAFGGLPQGAVLTVNGVQLQISYTGADGNDVTLTVFQNTGLICTPFTDVDQSNPLCPNVQWMKNRGVTIGCTTTLYCPADATTRLQMAVFMNRLGNVLSGTPQVLAFPSVSLTGAATEVICQAPDQAAATYERQVTLDAVLMGLGGGSAEYTLEPVTSVDAGANWIALAPPVPFSVFNGHWANVRASGDRDVAPTEVVRYGLRLSRTSGTGFTEARCALRLVTGNRVTGTPP